MKLAVDMNALQTVVTGAPAQAAAVSEQARRTQKRTEGSLRDRLARLADLSLDDIEDMLEPEIVDGKVRSKVSEATRRQLRCWLVEMAPDIRETKQQTPTLRVELAVGSIDMAEKSAQWAQARVTSGPAKAMEAAAS